MIDNCPYLEIQCENLTCECAKYKAYIDAKNENIVERVLAENQFDTTQAPWDLLMQMQKSFASRIRNIENPTKEDVDKWVDKYLICIEDEIREVREHLTLYAHKEDNTQDNTQDNSNIGTYTNVDCNIKKSEIEINIDIDNIAPQTNETIITDKGVLKLEEIERVKKIVKDDKKELKKEVIDILHFMLDLFIVGNATNEDIKNFYCQYYNLTLDEKNKDLIEEAFELQKNDINEYLYTDEDINEDITILKASCKLSDACALVRQQISWKHWKKPNDSISFDKLYHAYAEVFHEFINLCILTMDDVNEIKNIYINKNVENILRQEYGY